GRGGVEEMATSNHASQVCERVGSVWNGQAVASLGGDHDGSSSFGASIGVAGPCEGAPHQLDPSKRPSSASRARSGGLRVSFADFGVASRDGVEDWPTSNRDEHVRSGVPPGGNLTVPIGPKGM